MANTVGTTSSVDHDPAPLEGYWPGSAGEQLNYWRRRATAAEARALRLDEELATLRASQAKP